MNRKRPGPGREPGPRVTATDPATTQVDCHENSALDPETVVVGIVELDLDDVDLRSVPASIDGVRVRLPAGWIDSGDLARLATATYGAQNVEIVGRDARAVAEAVDFVQRRHDQWSRQLDETPDQEDPKRRSPVNHGPSFMELTARRRVPATPVRCTHRGCVAVLSVPPSSDLAAVRCPAHKGRAPS